MSMRKKNIERSRNVFADLIVIQYATIEKKSKLVNKKINFNVNILFSSVTLVHVRIFDFEKSKFNSRCNDLCHADISFSIRMSGP